MNPQTGRPVEGMASVTVLAARQQADALSTSAFVMGLEAVPGLLARAGGRRHCCAGPAAAGNMDHAGLGGTLSPQPGVEDSVHVFEP